MHLAHLLLPLALLLEAWPAVAQPNLRTTFPGRRVGGGTRGECTARVLAHLVPGTSVFAPGPAALVGLLEGPTANPRPITISFRQANAAGSSDSAQALQLRRELPASTAGVTLLKVPLKGPTVWESVYRCEEASAASTDPLNFVTSAAPPAVTLLLLDSTPADTALQARLAQLKTACGATVTRQQLASSFDLTDVITADWPEQLPVRCLF